MDRYSRQVFSNVQYENRLETQKMVAGLERHERFDYGSAIPPAKDLFAAGLSDHCYKFVQIVVKEALARQLCRAYLRRSTREIYATPGRQSIARKRYDRCGQRAGQSVIVLYCCER